MPDIVNHHKIYSKPDDNKVLIIKNANDVNASTSQFNN